MGAFAGIVVVKIGNGYAMPRSCSRATQEQPLGPAIIGKKGKLKKQRHGEGAAFAIRKDKLVADLTVLQARLTGDKPFSFAKKLSTPAAELSQRAGSEKDCLCHTDALLMRAQVTPGDAKILADKVAGGENIAEVCGFDTQTAKLVNGANDLSLCGDTQLDTAKHKAESKINEARGKIVGVCGWEGC